MRSAVRTIGNDATGPGVCVCGGRRGGSARPRRAGFSLVELMVALVILGVITAFAVPSFRRTLEQARADQAVANLRAIWAAERLFWLAQRSGYTETWSDLIKEDPDDPEELDLLDPSLDPAYWEGKPGHPHYSYGIALTSSGFTASAYRWGSEEPSFTIDQVGYIENYDSSISSTFYD